MRTTAFAITAAVLVLGGAESSSRAGVILGAVLEDKGVFQPTVPVKVFTSSMYAKLVSGWGPRDGQEFFRLNNEKIVLVPAGPPVHVYNLTPAVIHVPQPGGFANPNAPISFFDVFVGDIGDTGQIGGVPNDWTLTEAQILDGLGNVHNGTISLLNDLTTQLPTSNANDTSIQWDLSSISQKQGRFFLVEFTMTGYQLMGIPEPASLAMSLIGGAGLLAYRWRRRRRADRA